MWPTAQCTPDLGYATVAVAATSSASMRCAALYRNVCRSLLVSPIRDFATKSMPGSACIRLVFCWSKGCLQMQRQGRLGPVHSTAKEDACAYACKVALLHSSRCCTLLALPLSLSCSQKAHNWLTSCTKPTSRHCSFQEDLQRL
jgi:hypothetical protein